MTSFIRAATIRAARTAAQAALAVIGAGAFSVISADWAAIGSISAGAAVVSLLTSIATGLPEDGPDTVIVVPAEVGGE